MRHEIAELLLCSQSLRQQLAETRARMAVVADQVALTNDRLAEDRGDPRYRQLASDARDRARRLRSATELAADR